jgi:ABC-type oligopeptide transport system substrate-binding subunit
MRRKAVWFALLLALALVASACSGSSDDTESDTADTATTTAPAEDTTETTAAAAAAATTVAPDPGFVGESLEAGGCDYGGRVDSITALDEFTAEFTLCGPHPAFLAQIAFGVFGIQPAEHLEATGGAPLDNPIGTGPVLAQGVGQRRLSRLHPQ